MVYTFFWLLQSEQQWNCILALSNLLHALNAKLASIELLRLGGVEVCFFFTSLFFCFCFQQITTIRLSRIFCQHYKLIWTSILLQCNVFNDVQIDSNYKSTTTFSSFVILFFLDIARVTTHLQQPTLQQVNRQKQKTITTTFHCY
jgi:hypothetical protein